MDSPPIQDNEPGIDNVFLAASQQFQSEGTEHAVETQSMRRRFSDACSDSPQHARYLKIGTVAMQRGRDPRFRAHRPVLAINPQAVACRQGQGTQIQILHLLKLLKPQVTIWQLR